VQKLNRATVAAPDMPPEYLAQFLAAEIRKWEGPIKASGIAF
jgi:hypothetical protein